jgi:hypothetical protein
MADDTPSRRQSISLTPEAHGLENMGAEFLESMVCPLPQLCLGLLGLLGLSQARGGGGDSGGKPLCPLSSLTPPSLLPPPGLCSYGQGTSDVSASPTKSSLLYSSP